MTSIFDSTPLSQDNGINWDTAIEDAGINATIERLSRHQKLMLIELLVSRSHTLRYSTYKVFERLGFVHDRLEPDFWHIGRHWDVLTADGTIAALRLLDPKYQDGTLFYQLRRQRIVKENALRELRGVK